MAQKASGPAKKKGGKGAKPPRVSAEIVKLASRKGRNGAAPGSNSGEPIVSQLMQTVGKKDEENFLRWDKKIRTQNKTLAAALKVASEERSSLAGLFSSAKEDGVPAHRLNVLKKLMKEEARDQADVVAEHKEMAWQVKVTSSPLSQLGLFDMAEPTPDGYEQIGFNAGKNGETMNPPGKPNEDRHARYVDGWKRGQKESAEAVFKATGEHPDNAEALDI